MKPIRIKNGIVYLVESLASCPYCGNHVEINDVFDKYCKSHKQTVKHKCKKCKRFMGITQDIKGNIISFELKYSKYLNNKAITKIL